MSLLQSQPYFSHITFFQNASSTLKLQAHLINIALFFHPTNPNPKPPVFWPLHTCSQAIHGMLLPPPFFPHKKPLTNFSKSLTTPTGARKRAIWYTGTT